MSEIGDRVRGIRLPFHILPLIAACCSLARPALADTHYVSLSGGHIAPYTNWVTAATNIQDAIDASSNGDMVLVSDGVYSTGGRVVHGAMTNRVVIDKAITVQSVNGPEVTMIKGAGPIGNSAVRCVYVVSNATLSGFTLTNGATRTSGNLDLEQSGGGAWCESSGVLSNCVLTGNSATSGGGSYNGTLNNCVLTGNSATYRGGGSYKGTLNNCVLTGNSSDGNGGGSYESTLNNCTLSGNSAYDGGGSYKGTLNNCVLTGNSADGIGGVGGGSCNGTLNNCTFSGNSAGYGGGLYDSTLNNCIVYFNTALSGTNYQSATFNYSCTTPDPGGTGNITNDPQFVNVSASNFHLQATSPCINAGTNQAWMIGAVDLDGRPRIFGGTVDMGAYEYTDDTDGDGMPDWWESMHGMNPAISNAPGSNADGDWMTDVEEYWADTQPTNGLSYFPPLTVTNAVPGAMELVINPTSTARVYRIFMNTNLLAAPQAWVPYGSVQPGTGSELIFSVTNDLPQENYRAGVGLP
ncbi:MAG: hypothetical protein M9963_12150 [Kiritimatiellae bacterium]|nr:hypothetical protein [Kiritimatiellia bacterium]MCO5067068.1 hypothetical protein [Kiritimatiellia bacterium]